MDQPALDELGVYLLSGADADPTALAEEARRAEELGLGTAFLAERWTMNVEAAALSGAACAVTNRMRVGTAATNHNLRHPVVNAAWAATMHRMSLGRFMLGIGPGVAAVHRSMGLPPVATEQMRDWASLMRRLWSGQPILDHDGPAGKFPLLRIDTEPLEAPVPLGIVAFHDEDLALGGEVFDDVILHTFLNEKALSDAVQIVKTAAESAGRDPASVRVWSCLITVGNHLPDDVRQRRTIARLANYLQYLGDEIVAKNQWDPAVLSRFRADAVVSSFNGPIETSARAEHLQHIAELLPPKWIESAAVGAPDRCANRIRAALDCGADRVILHSASPHELEPILRSYRTLTSRAQSANTSG